MSNESLSDPSYDAVEVAGAYDIVATHGTLGHALRAVGAGTVTVITGSGTERTWTVGDKEVVPCAIREIVSMAGPTGVRVHIPVPAAQRAGF